MPKYEAGQTVLVPCVVTEVHPQGYPFGLHANGGPNSHPNPLATDAEKAAALVEQADTVLVALPEGVRADNFGRLHMSADVKL